MNNFMNFCGDGLNAIMSKTFYTNQPLVILDFKVNYAALICGKKISLYLTKYSATDFVKCPLA